MLIFIVRRLGATVLLMWVVLTATFFLIHLAPGEPALLFSDPNFDPAQRSRLRQIYGLDQPLGVQYGTWLGHVVRGDWGNSLSLGRPAIQVVREALPNTAILAFAALFVQYGLGLTLGTFAAARPDTRADRTIRFVSLFLYALPSFWLAQLAIELLGVRWPLFPTSHMFSSSEPTLLPPTTRLLELLHHLVLPALTLGLSLSGSTIRYVRNGLLDVLGQDYIRAARAKGAGPRRVLLVHALPNAVGPVIQTFGIALPMLLSGALITESIFSWPGLGWTTWEAYKSQDYPLILACTALAGLLVILGNLFADLFQAWLDPRVRRAG